MRALQCAAFVGLSTLTAACAPTTMRASRPSSEDGLGLSRVVLYRNGVGYFERQGEVAGDMLRIKVREDQVDDLVKSLTVVDRRSGKAVSVSVPLVPETLRDGDMAMQFHRHLDATAGEGTFRQVEVAIRIHGKRSRDLVVSYVVDAPVWQPSYRVALPKDGKGKALMRAWAVVENLSGEDWTNVKLSLTAGAPFGFRYNDNNSQDRSERDDQSFRRDSPSRPRTQHTSGSRRYDIEAPVTVPSGSSTTVALLNADIVGEEMFMFDPRGGAGAGYEQNPFRVLRLTNSTPFVLESGPISIYSSGIFLGEGISEAVGANTSVTIPFAVEPSIQVTKESSISFEELKLLKIVRGTVFAQRFHRQRTMWKVQAQSIAVPGGFKLLIRHLRTGRSYELKTRPQGLEELKDAYLVPLTIARGVSTVSIELIEEARNQVRVSMHSTSFFRMIETALVSENFSVEERAELRPVVTLRQKMDNIDTQLQALNSGEGDTLDRIDQHRRSLDKLKGMKGASAAKMRAERARQLKDFAKRGDADELEITNLTEKREQLAIQLEEMLSTLTIIGTADALW